VDFTAAADAFSKRPVNKSSLRRGRRNQHVRRPHTGGQAVRYPAKRGIDKKNSPSMNGFLNRWAAWEETRKAFGDRADGG